jgi:hypothetical protein
MFVDASARNGNSVFPSQQLKLLESIWDWTVPLYFLLDVFLVLGVYKEKGFRYAGTTLPPSSTSDFVAATEKELCSRFSVPFIILFVEFRNICSSFGLLRNVCRSYVLSKLLISLPF